MLALRPAGVTALVALAVATFGAMLLSQLMLRPIHVIRSGLSRLGRGEFGVTLDLPPGEEFTALGTSFNALSERLSSVRGPSTDVEPLRAGVVNEDAVVIVRATGEVAFANASMKARLQDGAPSKSYTDLFPDSHPFRMLITRALQTKQSSDPIRVREPVLGGEPRRHVVTVEVMGTDGVFEGVLLTARDLTYASQIEHMARSSRRLASVGRLLAGVAHEVKNPLNAMAIHLELLKQKLRGLTDPPLTRGGSLGARPVADAATGSGLEGVNGNLLKHVEVIDREIRRLDQVMQNFLKFVRPGELKLQPIDLRLLVAELLPVLETQTDRASVKLLTTCAPDLPSINGDAGMLKQALINLALNACQAMPDGGTLRITCQRAPGDRVSIDIEDTGIGIAPEQLERIFDLYFTTKEQGSGIGLSLVYRIVQLHDGDVEVQSIVGRGTTFRILLPRRTPSEHEEPASLGVAVT